MSPEDVREQRQMLHQHLLAHMYTMPDLRLLDYCQHKILMGMEQEMLGFVLQPVALELVLQHLRENVEVIEALITRRDELNAQAETARSN